MRPPEGEGAGIPSGARRALLGFGALAAAIALFVLVARLRTPTPPRARGCRVAVAIEVPATDAAPLYLASRHPLRLGGVACRLVPVAAATPRAPLVVAAGSALGPGLQPFVLVAQRVGALLVARQPIAPHFLWHSLTGQVVVLPKATGDLGPSLVTAMVALHRVSGVSLLRGLGTSAFFAGTGAYLELPLWPAERLVAEGRAYIAADLAIQGGPVPAAVLAARTPFAQTHGPWLAAIALAVYREELTLDRRGGSLAARWPASLSDSARAGLGRALWRGTYEHLWPSDPRVEASLFTRLDVLLRTAGERTASPAAPVVLAAPAEEAMRRLAPPP